MGAKRFLIVGVIVLIPSVTLITFFFHTQRLISGEKTRVTVKSFTTAERKSSTMG